jgi:hypothetical protein
MVTWASGGDKHVNVFARAGLITNIGKNRFAFGVVGGSTACEDQLKRRSERLGQSIGFDHAQRILETIESGDLEQYWSIGVQTEAKFGGKHFLRGQIHAFSAERVDTRRHQILESRLLFLHG